MIIILKLSFLPTYLFNIRCSKISKIQDLEDPEQHSKKSKISNISNKLLVLGSFDRTRVLIPKFQNLQDPEQDSQNPRFQTFPEHNITHSRLIERVFLSRKSKIPNISKT